MSDKPSPGRNFEPTVAVKPDGALKHQRHELFACLLAEGLPLTDAWRAVKGENDGSSLRTRNKLMANANLQKRVADLTKEREELEADPLWGAALWQINQLYRFALTELDLGTMKEAVKMRIQITQQIAPQRKEAPPADEPPDPTAKGPGRPAAESPQTKRDPAAIRAHLMSMGKPAPEFTNDDDTEDAA